MGRPYNPHFQYYGSVIAVAVSHLATIAYNVDRSLKWDVEQQQFVGDEEANRCLDRARREPWAI